jgi:fatty-acid desaturase
MKPLLERALDPPHYDFVRDNRLYVPSTRELLIEFVRRLNVFQCKKNWLTLFSWSMSASFAIPLYLFLTEYFSFWLVAIGFIYSMVLMGSHGTFWLHRYGTHRAFTFRHPWLAFICRNLVLRVIPEEIYIISHYVHHRHSEQPGDPYNVHAGWLYCFLSDANHQNIRRDLSEKDYAQLCKMMDHTGVRLNSYTQYQRWGSLCHPFYTVLHYGLNWAFWYAVFFALGGHALATAIFGSAGVWAFGVRTFNFEGHGKGKDRRRDGIDFNRSDLSVNQLWPGWVSGEWHNNHHLYPSGARAGFHPSQIDLPWYFIRLLAAIGVISSYKDYRADFFRDHYDPWLENQKRCAQNPLPGGITP